MSGHLSCILAPLLITAVGLSSGCSTRQQDDAQTARSSAPSSAATPPQHAADAPRGDGDATAALDADGHTLTSSRGSYVITFTPEPQAIPLNELFTLEVQVVDAARGTPVDENTQLSVDAGMPAHHHGMNTRPLVERTGDGHFLVDGMLFHMPGEWELYFDLTRNGVTERARETVLLD